MSESVPVFARARNGDSFKEIQRLREFYGDSRLAAMLGIGKFAVGFRKQPIPVVRLAFLLHRLTFPTGQPLTIFELLTLGKFGAGKLMDGASNERTALRDYAEIKGFEGCSSGLKPDEPLFQVE